MQLKQRLEICGSCTNRKMDRERGLLCTLSNDKPAFEAMCPSYFGDQNEFNRLKRAEEEKQERENEALGHLEIFVKATDTSGKVSTTAKIIFGSLLILTSLAILAFGILLMNRVLYFAFAFLAFGIVAFATIKKKKSP